MVGSRDGGEPAVGDSLLISDDDVTDLAELDEFVAAADMFVLVAAFGNVPVCCGARCCRSPNPSLMSVVPDSINFRFNFSRNTGLELASCKAIRREGE